MYFNIISLLKSLFENGRQVYFGLNDALRNLKKLGFNMIFSLILDFTTNSSEYIYEKNFY